MSELKKEKSYALVNAGITFLTKGGQLPHIYSKLKEDSVVLLDIDLRNGIGVEGKVVGAPDLIGMWQREMKRRRLIHHFIVLARSGEHAEVFVVDLGQLLTMDMKESLAFYKMDRRDQCVWIEQRVPHYKDRKEGIVVLQTYKTVGNGYMGLLASFDTGRSGINYVFRNPEDGKTLGSFRAVVVGKFLEVTFKDVSYFHKHAELAASWMAADLGDLTLRIDGKVVKIDPVDQPNST